MQTYTHFLIGGVTATIFFPNDTIAQVACLGASIIPDLTMVPQYIRDLFRGCPPLANQSARLMTIKEIGHSIPVWVCILIAGIFFGMQPMTAIGLGGLCHIGIDMLTHGVGLRKTRPYWDTDVKFMWPTSVDLRPLGVWEYRLGVGILRPKVTEIAVMTICALVIILNF